MLKHFFLYKFLLGIIVITTSCNNDRACSFVTADEFEKVDLVKCKTDSFYFQMKRFALSFNGFRKAHGIPPLPGHFQNVIYTEEIVWQSQKHMGMNRVKEPCYLKKNLNWNGDTLFYDQSIFSLNDSAERYVAITYSRDSIGNYTLRHYIESINDTIPVTKEAADSILKIYGLHY